MENDIVYITGHKNPDTDSICSVIAYAELKQKLGINALPMRLGDINRETEFVLKYFNVQLPRLLQTVKTQISDLDIDNVSPVTPDISIKTAWNIMRKKNKKTLPVVDEHERLLSVVTLSDLTAKYMDALENNSIAASNTTLRNVVETLNAKLLCGTQEDFLTTGKVMVAAIAPEEMHTCIEKGDIVITGNREDSQLKALECGANCMIITMGGQPTDLVIKTAKEHKAIVMVTAADTFTTARLINQSIPVGYVMSKNDITKFNIEEFVDEISDKMLKTRYRSYPIVDENNKIRGALSRYHLIARKKKKVILLDHNEKTQTVHGIEQAEVLEIIDHHRLGDIQTNNPIFVKNEPVGSTSTIIANLYFDAGIRPAKNIAGLMCAAILSDTLKFKSPTCTYTDRITAEKLAEIADINIEEFTTAMFKAGSSLQGKTPKDIFNQDLKEYRIEKHRIAIGQIYTLDMESVADVKENLLEYMETFSKQSRYDLVMLLVTDILNQGSELLFVGSSKELIGKAFNVNLVGNSIYLPGVVSRKKQVIPTISSVQN